MAIVSMISPSILFLLSSSLIFFNFFKRAIFLSSLAIGHYLHSPFWHHLGFFPLDFILSPVGHTKSALVMPLAKVNFHLAIRAVRRFDFFHYHFYSLLLLNNGISRNPSIPRNLSIPRNPSIPKNLSVLKNLSVPKNLSVIINPSISILAQILLAFNPPT